MKNQLLAVVAVLALSAGAAYGAPVAGSPGLGVVGSVHDMNASNGGAYAGGAETQGRICAYCHTPHHADQTVTDAPLWSRAANANPYTPYVSSTFNAPGTPGFTDAAYGPTRLCLSCHDASIAIDSHYGYVGGTAHINSSDTYGGPNVGAGGNLANDHPLGFDYNAVSCPTSGVGGNADETYDAVNCNPAVNGLYPFIRNAVPGGVPVLTYRGNTNYTVAERLSNGVMTCATCHDVHNRKNLNVDNMTTQPKNYLLLSPQQDSALCLTCHIK